MLLAPAPYFCLAVGGDRSGRRGAVVAITNGKPGRTVFVSGVGELVSIGCASPSSCWALGADPTGRRYPVGVHISGPSDTVYALRGASPALFKAGAFVGSGGSPFCTTRNVCIAVGALSTSAPGGGGPAAVTVLANGKIRSITPVPGVDALVGLACPSPRWCIATGFVGSLRGYAVVVTIANGKPVAVHRLREFSQQLGGTSLLDQPGCRTARVCWAFGNEGIPSHPVVIPINDGKPSAAQSAAIDGQGTWCGRSGCVAVGELANHPSVVGAIYPFSRPQPPPPRTARRTPGRRTPSNRDSPSDRSITDSEPA